MLSGVIIYNYDIKPYYNKYQQPRFIKTNNTQNQDTVCFTGKSAPSMYNTVFEYLAAEILGSNKKYCVDGSMLSASKIGDAVKTLVNEGRFFLPFKFSISDKIKWKSYIPKDVREYSIGKINDARIKRMEEWHDLLKYLDRAPKVNDEEHLPELISKLKKDDSLRLVIWNSISSELKENNRHLPVPLNEKALLDTIEGFEKIDPKDRAVRCASPSFLEMYTHRLRDNKLMEMGISENDSVWVKIPSIKHDPLHRRENINNLEILSCKNWCTRSSVDKAEAALEDGDFYIYLKRNPMNLWEPLVGMTTSRGKIDQIQGVENNNIVPLNLVSEIKSYITSRNLQCGSGVFDEGPKATQAIMISEKLNELDDISKKTFVKAIKDNNNEAVFRFLNVDAKVLEDGTLEIASYKPSYVLNPKNGTVVPYSMFGINENELLKNVKVINGDLVLHNKNQIFCSNITQFPPKLEKVKGKIVCSKEQYERFKPEIDRLVGDNPYKLIIRS
ncbi:MAG: hypothetical protein ACI37Q_00805 [Candidatus Gastranaerophilaceae bacterium]